MNGSEPKKPLDQWAPYSNESAKQDAAAYWQGVYCGPEHTAEYAVAQEDRTADSRSSLSAAVRRSYAAEAIWQKDHVSAGLLAVFLGLFGVHKFYLGCNNAGFVMLAVTVIGGILTFGLAAAVIWLIAIIEGIIYLSKTQTEFDKRYVLNQRDWF